MSGESKFQWFHGIKTIELKSSHHIDEKINGFFHELDQKVTDGEYEEVEIEDVDMNLNQGFGYDRSIIFVRYKYKKKV